MERWSGGCCLRTQFQLINIWVTWLSAALSFWTLSSINSIFLLLYTFEKDTVFQHILLLVCLCVDYYRYISIMYLSGLIWKYVVTCQARLKCLHYSFPPLLCSLSRCQIPIWFQPVKSGHAVDRSPSDFELANQQLGLYINGAHLQKFLFYPTSALFKQTCWEH